MRWTSLGGILGPALFVGVVVICAALRPGYSHAAQFISELGATGTPHAALMNFAGFVASGTLIGAFGLSLATALPRGRGSSGVALLIGIFGLGTILAGVFPCAPGCPQDEPTIHDSVAIAAFLSAIAGLGLAGGAFRASPSWKPLWLYSAISSAAALSFLALLASSLEVRALTGLWQRLLVGTIFVWCAVVGLRAYALGAESARPTAAE